MPILDMTRAAALAVALAAGGGVAACSFVVESQDHQCESDDDCSRFDDAVCDEKAGVCVPRETSATTAANGPAASTDASSSESASSTASTASGDECVGPDGCFDCAPTAQPEFLNHCTDAACIPFDNAQIADLLEEDGSLPPVP